MNPRLEACRPKAACAAWHDSSMMRRTERCKVWQEERHVVEQAQAAQWTGVVHLCQGKRTERARP